MRATRDAQKRGGSAARFRSKNAFVYTDEQSWQVVALHEALTKLSEWDERQARIRGDAVFRRAQRGGNRRGLTLFVKREFQHAKGPGSTETSAGISTSSHDDRGAMDAD